MAAAAPTDSALIGAAGEFCCASFECGEVRSF